MRKVRSRNTSPELLIRRHLHRLGYRYRLHRSDLPGKPDIVFVSRKIVIFINGCFWHGHNCRRGMRVPKSNTAYWMQKIARNKRRDLEHVEQLVSEGWKIVTIWECETKNMETCLSIIRQCLDDD